MNPAVAAGHAGLQAAGPSSNNVLRLRVPVTGRRKPFYLQRHQRQPSPGYEIVAADFIKKAIRCKRDLPGYPSKAPAGDRMRAMARL